MSEPLTATSGLFEIVEDEAWPMRIHVEGAGYAQRASLLRAKVGAVPVGQIRTYATENGFTGVLEQVPADGDVLAIGWAEDVELIATPVVFHTGPNV